MKKKLLINIATVVVTLYFVVSITSFLDKQVIIIVSQIYQYFLIQSCYRPTLLLTVTPSFTFFSFAGLTN